MPLTDDFAVERSEEGPPSQVVAIAEQALVGEAARSPRVMTAGLSWTIDAAYCLS